MALEQIVFYFFSAILVLSAGLVVTLRNPVFCALSLVLAFFTSAGIWILLEAEFLALTLVLVYVGAVMVLFLFVVMMLDINLAVLREGFTRYLPFGLVVAIIMAAQLAFIVSPEQFGLEAMPVPPPHP
ncbi:MAG: NADH-quinone oxidoreductase subunit J, partial [Gammaproteobacteria bacterium]|nr:NADH-quinone oxidoreductase subunit J [Gammaproteobacteria bacterium]